jgi:hypothetical protein
MNFTNTLSADAGSKHKRNNNERTIMLIKTKTVVGYKLDALDGEIGKVREFYFDDRHWAVRYLVAETGTWLADRQVLLAPYALLAVNQDEKSIAVDLTKKQIEDSPSIDKHKPVSHQFEQEYYGYYGYPVYWGGPYSWGAYPYFVRDRETRAHEKYQKNAQRENHWDPHLRSTDSVSGHHIQALDGEVGHVSDFIIDDETWAIRYLVVSTHNWWPGKKVLVSPQWIERVSWDERKVFVNLSREAVKDSPEYTDEALLTRDYEISLLGHYNRKGYWVDELVKS